MAITLRTASHDSATTKGRALTHAELDANFTSFLDSGGSSLLGFIQSGTGAVSRTVQGRLRDWVSVLDFIPVAEHAAIIARSSTTDVSTYIQAAIDAIETAGGGTVFFPIGTYRIDTGLVVAENYVSLVGAGPNATRLNYHGSAKAIQITSQLMSAVKGLRLNDSGGNGTVGYANNYVAATTNFSHRLEDVHIFGFDRGVECTNIEFFYACMVNVDGSGLGFYIDNDDHSGGSNGIANVFIQCRAANCTGNGWEVGNQTGSQFMSCEALSNGATNAQFFVRGTCDTLTILHLDVENATQATTGLSISGSGHIISVRAFSLTTAVALSTCTRSILLPSVYSTVTAGTSVDSGSVNNVFFDSGHSFSLNASSNGRNQFIGGSSIPLERLQGWVADDATNPSLGTLPADSYVVNVRIQVTELFNSDGDDLISVGYDADNIAFATTTDVSTTGIKTVTLGSLAGYNATARSVEAYYTDTGSAPTTGKALVILEYFRVQTQVS
jgi:hypothetical protein